MLRPVSWGVGDFRDLNTLPLSLADLPLFISQSREAVQRLLRISKSKLEEKNKDFLFQDKSFSIPTVCVMQGKIPNDRVKILVLQLRPDAAK